MAKVMLLMRAFLLSAVAGGSGHLSANEGPLKPISVAVASTEGETVRGPVSRTESAELEGSLYVSYAPDRLYSGNGRDSRIFIDTESAVGAYGHTFEKVSRCSEASERCVAMDFMAFASAPELMSPGHFIVDGPFKFSTVKEESFSLLGTVVSGVRVNVYRSGEQTNAYYLSPKIGIFAIVLENVENDRIKESIFFLSGSCGLFSPADCGSVN